MVAFPTGDDFSRYRFRVRLPDETTKSVYLSDWVNWMMVEGDVRAKPPKPLDPGQAQILDYALAFGVGDTAAPVRNTRELRKKAEPVFPLPGSYEVQLTLCGFSPPLESNVLQVTIKPPADAADILAYDILSHSVWPTMFLNPPADILCFQGVSSFDYSGFLRKGSAATSSVLESCRTILARCPNSAYVAYARLFLGAALSTAWGQRRRVFNPDEEAKGVRLLREAAEDPNLPRRYREQALLTLCSAVERIDSWLQHSGRNKMPSIESILGVASVDTGGLSAGSIFHTVHRTLEGTALPGEHKLLASKFTSEQIELLAKAVQSNSDIIEAAGVSPLQKELQEHAQWARQELCKIPWRDPENGRLNIGQLPAYGRFF
ncbi:hypothetical protein AMJ85_11255 [candidate division BRC1 bacterium SM23_51]|nr:MAG: hypothetical protein AMJ85_11255 [candidate division BRC1 bacterium SM23_51]